MHSFPPNNRYEQSLNECSEQINSLESTLEETNEINRRMTQEIEDTQNEIKRITECHDAVVNQLNDLQKKSHVKEQQYSAMVSFF